MTMGGEGVDPPPPGWAEVFCVENIWNQSVAGRVRLQNIDFKELAYKISEINELREAQSARDVSS